MGAAAHEMREIGAYTLLSGSMQSMHQLCYGLSQNLKKEFVLNTYVCLLVYDECITSKTPATLFYKTADS